MPGLARRGDGLGVVAVSEDLPAPAVLNGLHPGAAAGLPNAPRPSTFVLCLGSGSGDDQTMRGRANPASPPQLFSHLIPAILALSACGANHENDDLSEAAGRIGPNPVVEEYQALDAAPAEVAESPLVDAARPQVEPPAPGDSGEGTDPMQPSLVEVAQESLRTLLASSSTALVARCLEVAPYLHVATPGDEPEVRSRVRFSVIEVLRGSLAETDITGDVAGGTWQAIQTTSSHGAVYSAGQDYLLLPRRTLPGQQITIPDDDLSVAALTEFSVNYMGKTFPRTAIPALEEAQ